MPQAIGVIFPPLRILLIFHVTYEVARQTRGRFGHRVRLYLLYVSTLVILVSSVAVMVVERNAPGATITSFGDALWWAAETVSTVGYGDMYPVTLAGRVIAVVLDDQRLRHFVSPHCHSGSEVREQSARVRAPRRA